MRLGAEMNAEGRPEHRRPDLGGRSSEAEPEEDDHGAVLVVLVVAAIVLVSGVGAFGRTVRRR